MSKEVLQPKDILDDVLSSTKALYNIYSVFSTEVSNEDTLFTIEEGECEPNDDTCEKQRNDFFHTKPILRNMYFYKYSAFLVEFCNRYSIFLYLCVRI